MLVQVRFTFSSPAAVGGGVLERRRGPAEKKGFRRGGVLGMRREKERFWRRGEVLERKRGKGGSGEDERFCKVGEVLARRMGSGEQKGEGEEERFWG